MKGGLETRLHNYLTYFLNRGDDVTIICSTIEEQTSLPNTVEIVKLNVRYIPKPFRPFAFYKKVKKYLNDAPFDFSLSLGRTAGQHAVLAPSTHLAYLKYMKTKTRKLSDYMQVFLDRISYETSNIVFACSEMLKEELIDLYKIDSSKIKVLYPPFNPSNFNRELISEKESLRKEMSYTNDQQLFLFVSTGHKRKGLNFLLKLFQKLGNRYQLLIVGTPEVHSHLKNVQYVGYEKNTSKWYAMCDYLIHPARYEAFGQIITESLYMQTPVIISDRVGAKELIGEQEGLVLPEGDLENWIRTIEQLDKDQFRVVNDFVTVHKLGLEDHMNKMLEYAV